MCICKYLYYIYLKGRYDFLCRLHTTHAHIIICVVCIGFSLHTLYNVHT